ncbi:MAG: GNAT family N-acetyltransferase [Burkholderiaceae bacterium]
MSDSSSLPVQGLQIRSMRRDELDMALDWAAAEGWNPGLQDAQPFFEADPGGFLLGSVDGQPVSMIAATRYGTGYGFIGFYIAHPESRGRGLGFAVWQAAMARLEGRIIGLDGVIAQQDNYRKSGFVLAHRNVRYEGRSQGSAAEQAPRGLSLRTINAASVAAPASPYGAVAGAAAGAVPDTVSFAQLLDYDRRFFPASRDAFLQSWVTQPASVVRVLVSDIGGIEGYGVIRACRSGWKIGPLFAQTPLAAEALFNALKAQVPAGEPVFLDIPQSQPEALALVERHAMTPMFETARMYKGPAPEISLGCTYGITSFELG